MTKLEVQSFPLEILYREIAAALTEEEIKGQIKRFSEGKRTDVIRNCPLCQKLRNTYDPGGLSDCCFDCPYYRFNDRFHTGCQQFSVIRYDGWEKDPKDNHDYFGPAARAAALDRYQQALKIKQGEVK